MKHKMLPINPPQQRSDATQDPSSIEILPEGNGESSEDNRIMAADGQPHVIP